MWKAYVNKKRQGERRPSDFYETPICLTEELLKTGELDDVHTVLEPCCGMYAMSKVLENAGKVVLSRDLIYGNNFLIDEYKEQSFDAVVTNPPFSLWDEGITKAKTIGRKVVAIGKPNFFGAHSRYVSGIWNELKCVYIFTRQVDYQFPIQDDGSIGVGNLITGFFVWEHGYKGDPSVRLIDINDYCKLGSYEAYVKKNGQPDHQIINKARAAGINIKE